MQKNKTQILKKLVALTFFALVLTFNQTSFAAQPPGVTTTPYEVSYSARLTDPSNNPITTTHQARFSLWSDDDYDATDVMPDGSINPAAGGYAGWNETHTVTPDSNGLFHVYLGSITTLPNFTLSTHKYLQVEVKTNGAAETAYEVLDPTGDTTDLSDRHIVTSAAFAINSDTLDNHDAGTGPGDIPVLNINSQLDITTIPGGTDSDSFVLDFDNTVNAGSINLQFGNTLNKVLKYDLANTWFDFNDDVNIQGDLYVSGTINGAIVNTSTVGPYDQGLVLEPAYPNAVIQSDGLNNNGKMEMYYEDTDGDPGNGNNNHYKWTTRQPTMQDMNIVIKVEVPTGFKYFKTTPVELTYKTEDANTANNKVDVVIQDTSGSTVALSGGTSLASAAWVTQPITFTGTPTFTAGGQITIIIKTSAISGFAAYPGKLKLNFHGR